MRAFIALHSTPWCGRFEFEGACLIKIPNALCRGFQDVGDLPDWRRKLVDPNLFGSMPFLKNSYELQVVVFGADSKRNQHNETLLPISSLCSARTRYHAFIQWMQAE
jgi:hypothetical protein